jgi:hypothetical protein
VDILEKDGALEDDDDNLAMAQFALARAAWLSGERTPEVASRARAALRAFEHRGLGGQAADVSRWLALHPAPARR